VKKIIFIIIAMFSTSCSVDKLTVDNKPPVAVKGFSLIGPAYGYMEVTKEGPNATGNSFSAFFWPEPTLIGDRYGSTEYYKLILELKAIKANIDPTTEHLYHLYVKNEALRKKWCSSTLESTTSEDSPKRVSKDQTKTEANGNMCTDYHQYAVDPVSFTDCEQVDENLGTEKACECVLSSIQEISQRNPKLIANKTALAYCAFRNIDPDATDIKNWIYGGDREEKAVMGSYLALLEDGNNVKVEIQLENFDHLNYSTDTRADPALFGLITGEHYDSAKGTLKFQFAERDDKGKLTGNTYKFNLVRTNPFPSIPHFNRIEGEFKLFDSSGKMLRRGQSKFDSLMSPDRLANLKPEDSASDSEVGDELELEQ